MVFKVSPQSAELLREAHSMMGAFATGRMTFDIANGGRQTPLWRTDLHRHPYGLTRMGDDEGSSFKFVADGVESAVEQAKAFAGDKDVAVGAEIGRASCRERV